MNIKRTIIAAVVGLTLVAMVAPGVAQGVTIEELLAQIAVLQAQLLALQGGTGGTGTVPVACAGVTFTRALTVGSTGADVRCLQAALNAQGFTVATAGAGSPGSETTFFGPLTLTAVRAYQAAKGWAPANQVGPLTMGALNSYLASGPTTPTTPTTPGVTTPGVEGSIVATASPSPATGVELYTGQTTAVAAIDVKATASDVLLNRVDINFTASTGTGCNVRPWLNISSVTVSDGSTTKTLVVTSSSVIENAVGSSYTVRAEGLGILVSKDTTKKVTISVTGASALPVGATTCAVAMNFPINAVRGTDGASVSQYTPTSAAVGARTFTVKTGDTGTLTVAVSTDNPKARNVLVSETVATENVILAKFNVEAKNNDVILRQVVAETCASDVLATVMPTVKLLDGSVELAATSTVAAAAGISATTTFADLNLRIPKGTTKTFTIAGNMAKTSGNYASGTTVYGLVYTAGVTGEDASTYGAVTAGGSTVTGGRVYLQEVAPTFTLVSTDIKAVAPTSASTVQSASAQIKFNVTAAGGDVYIRKYNATAASSGIYASTTEASASGTVNYTFSTNATEGTNGWRVSNGETKSFDVSAVITNNDAWSAGYFAAVGIGHIHWISEDADVSVVPIQTWGLEDFKTSEIFLNLIN